MATTIYKIAFISSGRMDFGLISSIMKEIQSNENFELQLIAMGAHTAPFFGGKPSITHLDDFMVNYAIETLDNGDADLNIVQAIASTAQKTCQAFDALKPDMVVIPGDRYEMLAVAQIATVMNIPIIHLYGGDVSYGAYDETMRHAITKLSHLHFVSNADAHRRVVQMGENPDYVFNHGSPALSYLDYFVPTTRQELSEQLGISWGRRNLLLTYHPVTRATEDAKAFLEALERLPDDTHLFLTMPNTDTHARKLYQVLQDFAEKRSNAWMFKALGQQRYLSMLAHVDAVVGNSSSGLYEAPTFKVPTVNIGERQRGRLSAASVLHCPCEVEAIVDTINKAYDFDCETIKNPYYKSESASQIVESIERHLPLGTLLSKEFCEQK